MTANNKQVNTKLFLNILKNADAGTLAKVVSKKTKPNEKTQEKATVKTVGETASKVGPIDQSNEMHDLLLKIYGFLKQSNENKLKLREQENNFKEENEIERAKRHRDLLATLGKIKLDSDTATKFEEESGMGVFDIVTSILGAFGGAKSALSLLTNIGRFFIFNPFGAALLLGTATISMLANDKNPEQTNQMLQNALNPASEAQNIVETIRDTSVIERRKQNLLAGRPNNKKSYNVFNPNKEENLKKEYLKEIGFDENTGLTAKERQQGFTGLDEQGNPVKESATKLETTTQLTAPGNVPSEQPAGTTATTEGTQVSPSKSLTPGESIVTPETVPPESQRLNNAIGENVSAKLQETLSANETVVVNNSKTTSSIGGSSTERPFLPSVRNLEPTFQKMILDSTRIV